MISPNLKIGDTFIDDGKKYEVVGFNQYGYSSKFVCFSNENPKVDKVIKVEDSDPKTDEFGKSYTKTEINRMPKEKLEILSKNLGLGIGTTSEMKEKIIAKLGL